MSEHPTPQPKRQRDRIRDRDYEQAPTSYRPLWQLILALAGLVALVAIAASVVDQLVLA